MANGRDQPRPRRWRLAVGAVIGVATLAMVSSSWIDRSDTYRLEIPVVGRVLLISNAGPVEVRNGDVNQLTSNESWLLNRPKIESLGDSDEVVVRVTCEGRLPCRSATVLTVLPGTEVVIVATEGSVLVDQMDGALTIYDGHGNTLLGALSGSVKVVSESGRVSGNGLSVSQIDVSTVSSEVALEFQTLPERVLVVTGRESTRLRLPEGDVTLMVTSPENLQNFEVESVLGSASVITIRSNGPVTITPPLEVQPKE